MKRVVYATARAGTAAVAVLAETSLAAPVAPIPAAVTADNRPIVQAHSLPDLHHTYYWHHHHYYHHLAVW